MSFINHVENPFTFKFIDSESDVFLELCNECKQTLRNVEILTLVLEDEEIPGDISAKVSISFADIKFIKSKEGVILSHKIWIDGKPSEAKRDQLLRLKKIAGQVLTYVLDISWDNAEGKRRFQRIPIRL